jgi:hypothetical protein
MPGNGRTHLLGRAARPLVAALAFTAALAEAVASVPDEPGAAAPRA